LLKKKSSERPQNRNTFALAAKDDHSTLNIEANRRASRTKLDSFDPTKRFRDKIAALAEPLLRMDRSGRTATVEEYVTPRSAPALNPSARRIIRCRSGYYGEPIRIHDE